MIVGGYREEVLNVILAQLLSKGGVVAAPEQIVHWSGLGRRMPDVMVLFQGLRTVIEGKVDDHPSAEAEVLADIQARIDQGIAHIGVALLYPAELRSIVSVSALRKRMALSSLRMAICSEAGTQGWTKGDVGYLASLLRRTFELLVAEDVVSQAVAALEVGVNRFAEAVSGSPAVAQRCAKVLGIGSPPTKQKRTYPRTVARVAGLTIANAMVFQDVLSAHDVRVEPLRQTLEAIDPVSALSKHWQFILEDIDYVPIFKCSRELLLSLPANRDIEEAVGFLGEQALYIVGQRAALRHDLMGRIYHRLLTEAKYLGAYYTSVPAATLLLKTALSPSLWQQEWADLGQLAGFRIGDLACGTGTLLMAAAEAVTDNYLRSCSLKEITPELRELHRHLIEGVLYGYDVLPSALHLTASSLALRVPEIGFQLTHLYSLPLGGPTARLGSLLLLVVVPLLVGWWLAQNLVPQPAVGIIRLNTDIWAGSARLAIAQIEAARKDPSIKAVVLQLDSPGGEVAATQALYLELQGMRRW